MSFLTSVAGSSPIADAISNDAFGRGVLVASKVFEAGNLVGVRLDAVDGGDVYPLGMVEVVGIGGGRLFDIRFDRRGSFSGNLLMSVRQAISNNPFVFAAEIIEINPQLVEVASYTRGAIDSFGGWEIDFSDEQTILAGDPSAWLVGLGSSPNFGSVSPETGIVATTGLGSLALGGIEFDRTGVWGGRLLIATDSVVWAYETGSAPLLVGRSTVGRLADISQAAIGPLGPATFVASHDPGLVFELAESGGLAPIAGSFDPISSIAVEPEGDALLVLEEDGDVFALRRLERTSCIADTTTTGTNPGDPGYGVPDGQVTATDLTYYVELWLNGCP